MNKTVKEVLLCGSSTPVSRNDISQPLVKCRPEALLLESLGILITRKPDELLSRLRKLRDCSNCMFIALSG